MPRRGTRASETPAAILGRRVRELRQERKLSQLVLAQRAGMRIGKLSQLENGRSGGRGPTLQRIYQVAEALEVPPSALLRPARAARGP